MVIWLLTVRAREEAVPPSLRPSPLEVQFITAAKMVHRIITSPSLKGGLRDAGISLSALVQTA